MEPRRALVVEDDPGLAEALAALLGRHDLEVERTPSGLAGVVRAAGPPALALAVLDIDVHELSGLGVARAIRDFSRVPLIVMSGREGPWCGEALAAGATACLVKPFHGPALDAVVSATLSVEAPRSPWPGDVRALSAEDLARLSKLSPGELDALPFGAIRLDGAGRITSFNSYEERLSGREPSSVIGRPFSQVAPCTQVREFLAPIEEGRAAGALDHVLRFVFPRRGILCVVSVRLFLDRTSGQLWLFVSQRPAGRVNGALSPEVG